MAHNAHSIEWSRKTPIVFPTKPEHEDKLGCVRGLVWGVIFEAVFSIAAIVVWLSVR
jgi:hypothetical protein